jgi:hypothetical protein
VSPPVAYASTKIIPFIPPDSPCTIFNDVLTEFTAFVAQFSPGATDLDGDEIRDTAMLQLFKMFSCQANTTTALAYATNVAYDDNHETFALEPNASALSAYSHIIPVLMSMSQAMQTYTLGLLSDGGTPLAGAYESVDCTDLTHCTPLFVEDPVLPATRTATEPYTAAGDADFDGFTNLTEYQNIIAIGGSDFDFAVHASTKGLNGTGGVKNPGGGCFIATAAYGTPMANELNRLRAVRDASLLTRPAGAAIVDAYYRLSPPAAAWIADRPSARAAVRALLAIALYRNIGFVLGASFIGGLALFVIVSRRTAGAVQRK